ncbi:MAG: DUF1573 domain-containing protein [Melioribacteraceae bacterium]|jgi:hypothetical protein|nr:DUF1573 domain-containing protein [Melioribacteraceae bacterium]
MIKKNIFVVLLFVATIVNAQLAGPKIYSLEKEHDFGQIVEGALVTHDFEVLNNGDAELYLIKVSSTCGCTVAKPEKEKLQPGESTKIRVSFNSSSRSGRQKKYINVFTNDQENTRYRLSITAIVVSKESKNNSPGTSAKISVEENQHNFGTVKEGSVLPWVLKFKNIGDAPLLITDVQKSCGCTATLLSSNELQPGESGNVKIELDTKGMKGKKSRTIALTSNDPFNPRMIITLFVDVQK